MTSQMCDHGNIWGRCPKCDGLPAATSSGAGPAMRERDLVDLTSPETAEELARAVDRVEKGIATRHPGATEASRQMARELLAAWRKARAER